MNNNFRQFVHAEEFIPQEVLNKIDAVINTRTASVDDKSDEMENIFAGSRFTPEGAGTNRYVFSHIDLPNVIFKIALDNHGREANLRSFYNPHVVGSDTLITGAESISEYANVIVQEQICRYRSAQEYSVALPAIKRLLMELDTLFVCVDTKLSNRHNFGYDPATGRPMVLDHGDFLPLSAYINQYGEEVDAGEGKFMRFHVHCPNEVALGGNMAPCGDVMHPEYDNHEFYECPTCGYRMTFHDAAEQIRNKMRNAGGNNQNGHGVYAGEIPEGLNYQEEFDYLMNSPLADFATSAMDYKNNDSQSDEAYTEIEGTLLDGYVIPDSLPVPLYSNKRRKVLAGQMTIDEFFKVIKKNKENYKIGRAHV